MMNLGPIRMNEVPKSRSIVDSVAARRKRAVDLVSRWTLAPVLTPATGASGLRPIFLSPENHTL